MIELDREQLLALVQTDAELSEILMRAFILRRVELIARGLGDVVLIGSTHCAGTLRVKEFLTRNGHPFAYIDLDRDADAQELLDRFHVSAADVPVLICRGDAVLRNPSNQQIAECLGFNDAIDRRRCAIWSSSARVRRVWRPRCTARPRVSTSSCSNRARPAVRPDRARRIENYLGFPTGISGQELTGRAYAQAQKFGAQIMIAKGATGLACDRQPYTVQIDEGVRVPARAVIIATGAEYRKPALENLSQFEGAGVYYARDADGSAALRRRGGRRGRRRQLRRAGGRVSRADAPSACTCWSARDGLADTMSRYLDSPHRGQPGDRAAHADGDRRPGRQRASRTGPLARQSDRRASRRTTSGTCS